MSQNDTESSIYNFQAKPFHIKYDISWSQGLARENKRVKLESKIPVVCSNERCKLWLLTNQ